MSAGADLMGASPMRDGWELKILGDILQVRNGFAFKSADYRPTGVLLLRQSNLAGARVSTDKAAYLPAEYLQVYSDFLVQEGDLLIGMSGSIGKLCVYDRGEPALQNQRTGLLQFKDPALRKWVWHYLPLVERDLLAGGKGVGVQNVSAAQIEALRIPIAPDGVRERIVAELEKQFSRLDEAVANLKRVKANLARQRAAILNAAIVGRLTAEREPALPRALNAGDPLPDGWQWLPAEKLAAPEQGSIGAGPFGTIFKAKDFRSEGVPIIFLRHVAPMRYLQHKPGFMDTLKWEELFQTYSVFGGELLITKLGEPPGVCAIYPSGVGPAMVTPDVIKMRVDESIAIPAYLMYYFNSDVAKRFATGAAFGTTRTRLTLPLFRAMPVVVPPRKEQERIVAEVDRRLSIVCEVEAEVNANLRRAEALRGQILRKAFHAPVSAIGDVTNEGTQRYVPA